MTDAKRSPEQDETRGAVALTIVWMLTCMCTAAGVLLVIAVLYHFLYVRPPAWLAEPVLEGGLARAGRAIRGWIGRRIGRSGALPAAMVPGRQVLTAEEPAPRPAMLADAEPPPSADEAPEPADAARHPSAGNGDARPQP